MGGSPGDSPTVLAHCAAVDRGHQAGPRHEPSSGPGPGAKDPPLKLGLAQWCLPREVVQVRAA